MFLLQYIADTFFSLFGSIHSAEIVLCLVVLSLFVWSALGSAREIGAVFRSYGRDFWGPTIAVLAASFLVGIFGVPTTFWAMNMHGLELYQEPFVVQALPDHGALLSLTYTLMTLGFTSWFQPWEISLVASSLSGLLFAL